MAGKIVARDVVLQRYGFVYSVTADGSIKESRMKWAGRPSSKIVARYIIDRRPGHMYYLKNGSVYETKMKKRGRK
jgi:hypothetical protein